MTTGERIRNRRKSLGISADELAEKIGVSRSTVFRYENGYIEKLPLNNLVPIAQALHTTPAHLMGWEDDNSSSIPGIMPPPNTYKVPRLGTIACGEPILAEESIETYDEVPEHVHCNFTLKCQGDSMIGARINDGDIAYIRIQPDVENGEIAAVLIDEMEGVAEATLKRVYKYPEQLVLQAENPKYPPFVFSGEEMNKVRIIGKAVGFTSVIE